jgi:HK97 family phage major capsid protein
MVQDIPLLTLDLTRAFGSELYWMLLNAVVNGSGSGMPQGILNSNCLIQIAPDAGQASQTITAGNIRNAISRMVDPCRQRAVWLCHPDVELWLEQAVNIEGTAATLSPAVLPLYYRDAMGFPQLAGRPLIPCEVCPPLGQAGDSDLRLS